VSKTEYAPVNVNDPALADRLRTVAQKTLGADHVETTDATMGSEDVGEFSLGNKIPELMFWLGAAEPAKLAHAREIGVPLPAMHSPLFAPDYKPTIETGVTAMTAMAMDLLK
jgi:metal-dependent amidase/aminoacylase/carboxypeptidase family protein